MLQPVASPPAGVRQTVEIGGCRIHFDFDGMVPHRGDCVPSIPRPAVPFAGTEWLVRVRALDPAPTTTAPWSLRWSEGERSAIVAIDETRRKKEIDPAFAAAVLGILRREGRLDLHAAAVLEPGGERALLIPGPAGIGKTSLAMALHLAGWPLLSDDHVLLWAQEPETRLVAASLRRPVFATADTLARLGGSVVPRHEVRAMGKHLVEPESDEVTRLGRPAALVFPERFSGPSRLEPLRAALAFERLLRAAPYLTAESEAVRCLEVAKHLTALPCFVLHAGPDLFDPECAARVMANALSLTPQA